MKSIYSSIANYYTRKVEQFGAQPQGVDWKDKTSQYTRFQQLSKLIARLDTFSINDLGCGYGELVQFLDGQGYDRYSYRGYDLSKAMIEQANARYPQRDGSDSELVSFTLVADAAEMQQADYTVASGIFNTRQDIGDSQWLEYIHYTLQVMDQCSVHGFAFNMLTAYSDQDRMRSDLFYAQPETMFEYCQKKFSRNIALLHDYELYEFTILVRKGQRV